MPVALEDKTFEEAFVYSIVGVGAFIIVITAILVIYCVYSQKEPDGSKIAFNEDEEGFGIAKHWQADYIATMKPEMNGYHF